MAPRMNPRVAAHGARWNGRFICTTMRWQHEQRRMKRLSAQRSSPQKCRRKQSTPFLAQQDTPILCQQRMLSLPYVQPLYTIRQTVNVKVGTKRKRVSLLVDERLGGVCCLSEPMPSD